MGEKFFRSLFLRTFQEFRSLKNAVCKLWEWFVIDQTLLTLLWFVLKEIDFVSFFFPLYVCLANCLHHLNTGASKRFKTGKLKGFLGAISPLQDVLVFRTIYETQLFGIWIG